MSAVAETRQTLTSVLVCRPAEPVLPENLASDIRRGAGGVGGGEPLEIFKPERWVSAEFRGQEYALSQCNFHCFYLVVAFGLRRFCTSNKKEFLSWRH